MALFMNFKKAILSLCLLALSSTYSLANVDFKDPSIPLWEINGQISKSDVKKIEDAAKFAVQNRRQAVFRLNTEGGDVEAAIAIGRQLRKIRAFAFTFEQGRCYSACIFILSGATKRGLSSSIGIHRPYSTSGELDHNKIDSSQRRLEKLAKEYLREVNVSPDLYDLMNTIPPEKIYFPSEYELQKLGIIEIDPVQQEFEDSNEAQSFGISKIEYYKRKSQINNACAREYQFGARTSDFNSYTQCRERVLRTGE